LQAVEPAAKKSPRSAPSPAAAAQKPEPTPGSAPPSGDSELKLPPQGAISAEQVKRLWTIARRELELGDEAVKAVVVAVTGQESTKAIPTAHYDKVLEELRLAAAAAKT
jgi:hypothetical protein